MEDLILGEAWLRPVHHLPGRPFGSGPAERRTIVGSLARHAEANPDDPFLTSIAEDGRCVTYGEAHRVVRRQAGVVIASGLGRGDRVGVLGHNSIEFALAVLSVIEAGGVAVLLSCQDPAARVLRQVEFAQAGLVLYDSAYLQLVEPCGGGAALLSFQQLGESGHRSDHPAPVATPSPTDAALVFYTSGTTGVPKAVVQSHYAVAQNAWSLSDHHGIARGTRLLCILPMHHVNGLEFTIFAVLLGGGHTTICRGFDGLRFWTIVRQHRIEVASLVPNLLRLLADRPGLRGPHVTDLRYIVSAAAPLSLAVARDVWNRLGLRIVQGYGLSEVTNFSCLMPTDLSDLDYVDRMFGGRRTCIGPSLPNQDVDIRIGEETAPPDVEGEIVIRGPCVMSGYLDNPSATEEVMGGGWVRTGDRGYYRLDAAGTRYFHVCGRTREIAKRGGAMVSLLELDELIASIPGVADAGAAAFANTWVDEEIAAIVVREPACSLTEQDILDHCRTVLPFGAMPKRIEFVTEVPRTASGKIRRAAISERFEPFGEHLFREPRSGPLDKDRPAEPDQTKDGTA